MKVGTKSVLFGAHCFFLHPWFVALAWWKMYGFPFDPRLWVAFFVHDLGYIGKPNMDGPEGETHPKLGAAIMRLFDMKPCDWEWREWSHGGKGVPWRCGTEEFNALLLDGWQIIEIASSFTLLGRPRYRWSDFCLLHSRYYAKALGRSYSRLCVADKMAFVLTPAWLYLPMVKATGEINEYLNRAKTADSTHGKWKAADYSKNVKEWHANLCEYMTQWANQHRDGAEDTWTSANRHARTDSGVRQ